MINWKGFQRWKDRIQSFDASEQAQALEGSSFSSLEKAQEMRARGTDHEAVARRLGCSSYSGNMLDQ